ncbi:MAG: hypothetical protein IH830_13235 [Planctomycetes bacterium]|nr:hypothetical protein [Planctomycetota bacterium]
MRRVPDAGLPRPTWPLFFLPIALGLALALPDTTRGQCQANELAKLTACDAAAGDEFGISVSISGDVAVIGARWDDDGGPVSGSAYVYRLNRATGEWEEEAKLTASDAAPSDEFGRSVSICNEVVVIGARFDDDGGSTSGSAYVYRFNGSGWVEEAKLTASDAAANDLFGISVSISGDVAVIGALYDSDDGFHSGSAYVYRFDGAIWVEEAKLTASDAAEGDLFGRSVSISGDVAVIGAFLDDDAGLDSGSAYVYRFDGRDWVEEAKLTASDATADDHFGGSVSVSAELAVIGAILDSDGGSHSGSAYVFRFNGSGWVEEAKLTASDAAAFDWFGWSVSVRGDIAVIGARFDVDSDPRFDSGSVYVFKEPPGGWVDMTETAKLTASDAGSFDNFGFSVSISGDMALMGAWHDDDVCPGDPPNCNSGSAYVFRGFSDCNDNGTLDLCDIADGTSTDANGNGVPDDCECLADLDGDSSVGILDLLALLPAWGTDPGGPPDFDGDGTVGILDLLTLLANWGPCP